jgi:hypothetical protein
MTPQDIFHMQIIPMLLMNYLRSVISQERLNGLATLCIEKHMLDDIDIDSIIIEFASRSVRRNSFK